MKLKNSEEEIASIYEKERLDNATLKKSYNSLHDELFFAEGEDEVNLQERIDTLFSHFADDFAKADSLAMRYQRIYRLVSIAIYFLSSFAVFVVSAQYIFDLSHGVGLLEVLAMVCIILILVQGNKTGWHRRWLDYRFLAERIRYGFYVSVFVEKEPEELKKILVKRWVGESWSLTYFRTLWMNRPESSSLKGVNIEVLKKFIKTSWLLGQKNFQSRKQEKAMRKHNLISKLSEMFFGLTLLAALLHLLPFSLHLFGLDIHLPSETAINRILTFLCIMFPTVAAACTALKSHFDYKKTADRCETTSHMLQNIIEELDTIESLGDLQQLVLEAELLMIQENSDWYVTVRLHELEAA